MDTMYWHEECVNKVCDYPNKSEILAFIVSRCRFVTQFFLLLKTQNKFISLSEKLEKEKKKNLLCCMKIIAIAAKSMFSDVYEQWFLDWVQPTTWFFLSLYLPQRIFPLFLQRSAYITVEKWVVSWKFNCTGSNSLLESKLKQLTIIVCS